MLWNKAESQKIFCAEAADQFLVYFRGFQEMEKFLQERAEVAEEKPGKKKKKKKQGSSSEGFSW